MHQHGFTRREFLSFGAAFLSSTTIPAAHAVSIQPLSQLSYSQVQLLDGPMQEQFKHNHELFLSLDEDSLLKPFRQLTGQAAPGEDMGGWYSPSPLFDPPKNMTGYVPGHTFGQYLSGLARAYAITGDKATQEKVNRLVAALVPTLQSKFYEHYPLPCYTYDKTVCGLIDAHTYVGTPNAMAALHQATDAVMPWLPPKALTRPEMAARPHPNEAYTWDESYTLPENLYLASKRGGGVRYRDLARRFLQDKDYFQPLADGKNVMVHEHAYSHLNALCSAMQAYLTDGSAMHLRAAQNGFRFALEQSYASGGWGPSESFRKPGTNELADSLTHTHASFEAPCGTYGHFKIARYLMAATGQSFYGDSMELLLYNAMLGALPIKPDGTSFYYADYSHDARKNYYEQKWPCCSGTFPQLTADYGISSYMQSAKGLRVNLYVPSRITWQQNGTQIALTQQTSYPSTNESELTLSMPRSESFEVGLRIPAWAGPATRVQVNGRNAGVEAHPGEWLLLQRRWKNGDRIEIAFDMPLRLVPLDAQHTNLVALMHGPTALFQVLPSAATPTKQALLSAQRNSNGWAVNTSTVPMQLKNYAEIREQHYRLYHEVQ